MFPKGELRAMELESTGLAPRNRSLVASIVQLIRADIQSGRLQPGTRLRQSSIAKAYDVSTTPVREAFSALEREGVLIRSPHRGVVVFAPRVEDMIETYKIRIALERLATETAVPNLTAAQLQLMRRAAIDMFETSDIQRHFELNRLFHQTLYGAAGMPRLEDMIHKLMDEAAAYQRMFNANHPRGAEKRIFDEHMGIHLACVNGDARAAASAVTEHLTNAVAAFEKTLVDGSTEDASDFD